MLPYLHFFHLHENHHEKTCLLFLTILLAACQNTPSVIPAATTAVPATESTPVSDANRTLTICLGYEPESFYLYAATSQAARDVLQAIYDGPFDTIDGKTVPVILTALPTVSTTPVSVQAGEQVVDTQGKVVKLQKNTQVFPSGCHEAACAITWDGSSALQLDQPSATFQLKEAITWSDGQPLTAEDSVYSFQLASDPAPPNE
jgi:peptide/nickel transport system substrate-binding protein